MPFDFQTATANVRIPSPDEYDLFFVDLFCGASGTTTGLLRACEAMGIRAFGIGINHWDLAIETSRAAHPHMLHIREDLVALTDQQVSNLIRSIRPSGVIDLLLASPSCTYHSPARRGLPIVEQDRVDPHVVTRWLTAPGVRVRRFVVENVPAFRDWGMLNSKGHPDPRKKGMFHHAWSENLKNLGYRYENRDLNAADFGARTTRTRYFGLGVAGSGKLSWPTPTHSKEGATDDLLDPRSKWRAAAEIIDWSIPGVDVYGRTTPLKPNTLRRLMTGAARFFGARSAIHLRCLEVELRRSQLRWGDGNPSTMPADTVAAIRNAIEELPPAPANDDDGASIVTMRGRSFAHSVADPLTTVSTKGAHHGLSQPAIITMRQHTEARAAGEPLTTVTTAGTHHGLAEPTDAPIAFHMSNQSEGAPRPVEAPIASIGTISKPILGQHSAFVATTANSTGGLAPRPADEPISTVTARGGHALVEDHRGITVSCCNTGGGGQARDINAPIQTVTTAQHLAVAADAAFVAPYYRTGTPYDVADPVHTITTKARHALLTGKSKAAKPVSPEDDALLAELDQRRRYIDADGSVKAVMLLFRMLNKKELGRAMGFPENYPFQGARNEDITRQIGNAVEIHQAQALCRVQLELLGFGKTLSRKKAA